MHANRDGVFLRADARIGKIYFSAALADALGERAFVELAGGTFTLRRAAEKCKGSRSIHRIGNGRRGIVYRELWERIPDGRIYLEQDERGGWTPAAASLAA